MRTGDKVIHKTKRVIETYKGTCMIKIGLSWVEGVIYEGDNYLTGMPTTFVRTKEDFEENFEPINPVMSADRYKYELFKEKFEKVDIDACLEQPFEIRNAARRELYGDLFKLTPRPEYKKKYGTLGRLIEQLQEAERYLGSDVEVFIRDKDGIHQPQIAIEQTPNELPVDKIVTIQ